MRKLPEFTYDPGQSFRGWLRTVLRNKWQEIQRRQPQPTAAGIPVEREGEDDIAAVAETEFQQHLTVRALQLMQAEFQPATWKACWEHVVLDRPAAEVAAELGVSVNAVYLATSRVLRRLRGELGDLWS